LEDGMRSERKNTALFVLASGLILGIPLEASAQANSPQAPLPGSVAVNFVVVDSFDSVSQWSTNPAKGVELTVHADSGRHGSDGDLPLIQSMLREHPELLHARSTRRHHATLLHYIGANGVEGIRQKTPANAIEITKTLLDAGAEPDAVADLYDNKCTTMSMLVSSAHPAQAGLQAALAETLLDYGAAPQGRGTAWQSPAMTALAFGYLDTAKALARRGAAPDTLSAAAGLGLVDEARRRLPIADNKERHIAIALAAQHGHTEIVRLLLDAGEDPNRYNPDGWHSHSTPLHQAIASDHGDVVRLLVERGARTDIKDTVYDGTALGWAVYCERPAIAEWLRTRGAKGS
jgi:ankyrin repeat protein